MIEFEQAKYEKFLYNNGSLAPSKSRTNSFHKVKRVGTNSITASSVNYSNSVKNMARVSGNAPHVDVDIPVQVDGDTLKVGSIASAIVDIGEITTGQVRHQVVTGLYHMPPSSRVCTSVILSTTQQLLSE